MHEHHERVLRRLRRITHLFDNALTIPGTSWRIGLDPIIGLIPGAGDLVSAGVSIWIVIEAQRLGIPRAALARMIGNVAVDFLVGSVPLVGDLFDAAWKCNVRNLALLERSLQKRSSEIELAAAKRRPGSRPE